MSKKKRVLGDLTIRLEPYKINEYDRSTKKVMVNDTQWGWIRTTWHGMHGTQFHLSDMHETIHRPDPTPNHRGRMIEVRCSSPRTRKARIRNALNKEEDQKPIPTSEDLILDMIVEAISKGWLRSPEVRNQEIASARQAMARQREASEQKEAAAWSKKIDEILALGLTTAPDSVQFQTDTLRKAVLAAMQWAQSL